jgi:hypothetical protein
MKLAVLLVLIWFLPLLSHADGDKWRLRQDSDAIRIYQQATESGYAITRGMMEMQTSLHVLLDIMKDSSTCRHWLFACKESHRVKQYNAKQRLDYTVIDSPLWFADRDMYIHSTTSFEPTSKTLVIQLSGREHHDKGKAGRVRLQNLRGLWRLQQSAPNTVRVLYQIYANPQLMPSALLDAYVVHSVFETLKSLNSLVEKK